MNDAAKESEKNAMQPPVRVEEGFANAGDATNRLGSLAAANQLAGPATLHAAPAESAIEAGFPPRAMRSMALSAVVGAVVGIILGPVLVHGTWLSGTWGGLLSAGSPAESTMLALILGGVGMLLGGLIGFGAADPATGSVPRARLVAMVEPDAARAPPEAGARDR